jgi:hypothetical protein
LGLTWNIINKFQIDEFPVEGGTLQDSLFLWVKKNTQDYDGFDIKNFSGSRNDGFAFCASINKF